MIEILIPTTLRPEILERTCASFRKQVFTDEVMARIPVGVHLNVDPVGPGKADEVCRAVEAHFSLLSWRYADTPSFPRAFVNLWQAVSGDLVFYLEDDWECCFPVDLIRMVEILETEQDLALLRLSWKHAGTGYLKAWKHFFEWNGRYFECPLKAKREVGFCGHPSLIRGAFVKEIVPYLDPSRNPEKQFHHGDPRLLLEVDDWRYGVFASPGEAPAIRDIGREWMVKHGFRKAGNKAFFTRWEKVPCPN